MENYLKTVSIASCWIIVFLPLFLILLKEIRDNLKKILDMQRQQANALEKLTKALSENLEEKNKKD